MKNPSLIPFGEVAKVHRQQFHRSCSVSAFEFVSKLYGLIPLNSYPLQSNPENQKKGFDEPILQSEIGLRPLSNRDNYNIQSALELMKEETSRGRFPIVSLRAYSEDGRMEGYHINVVVSEEGQLILIEPADGSIRAATTEDLKKELERSCIPLHPQVRNTIHILIVHPKTEQA